MTAWPKTSRQWIERLRAILAQSAAEPSPDEVEEALAILERTARPREAQELRRTLLWEACLAGHLDSAARLRAAAAVPIAIPATATITATTMSTKVNHISESTAPSMMASTVTPASPS